MKSHVLVVALFATCATGSLMSMLHDIKECKELRFVLNSSDCITDYSIKYHNRNVMYPKKDKVGQKLIDVLPFGDPTAIKFGKTGNQVEKVIPEKIWTLKGEKFLVKITPVIESDEKNYWTIEMKSWDPNNCNL